MSSRQSYSGPANRPQRGSNLFREPTQAEFIARQLKLLRTHATAADNRDTYVSLARSWIWTRSGGARKVQGNA